MQQQLPFKQNLDKVISLGEVERRLSQLLVDPPVRSTLIRHIECGWLLGYQNSFNKYYFVWESSLAEYTEKIVQSKEQIAA